MVTNNYSREWCSENYDKSKEDFYISNTRSLILSQWAVSIKHAIVTTLLVIVAAVLGWIDHPFAWLAAMQIGYAFYGVLTYCHNDMGAGGIAYICCLIYFINRIDSFPTWCKILFYLTGFLLWLASIIPTILYHKTLGSHGEAQKRQWESDEEEFEAWKQKYYNSAYENYYRENTYQQSHNSEQQGKTYDGTSNNYSSNQNIDPNVAKARELFADFGDTFQELKKRYRKLAMEHHPDHGGNNDLFAAIVNEYEFLKKTKFPDQR